ncbi:MAG: hypothetical protein JEZ00_02425 [Anaerolineaceae bacterium]|nr:hypothetical protein [Anaerolineaceae bacterium]
MKSKNKVLLSLIVLLIAVSISACGPSAPAEPTVDTNLIKTEALETAFAQMTQEALFNPTETPVPTETPLPTNTLAPTTTLAQATLPSIATSAVQPVATQATGNVVGAVNTGDKAQWISQEPDDGTKFYLRNAEEVPLFFDIFWTVENTGTTTWNDSYKLRYYVGDKFFRNETEFSFPKDISVAPGEQAALKIVASYPDDSGKYESVWVLTNPDGVNFQVLTIQIEVINDFPPD